MKLKNKDMAKYRFKRLDEYDKSELNSYSIPIGWCKDMEEYLGTDIPCSLDTSCDAKKGFGMDGWWFSGRDYIEKDKVLINNIVVENTSKEHGARIIKHFKSHGIDTRAHEGTMYGIKQPHRFYGVVDGRFDNYTLEAAQYHGASVVKLPEDVEKDDVEYFKDLSQHVGRYLKALVDHPHGGAVRAGEIGLIISSNRVDFPSRSDYWCLGALSKENLNIKYQLMPEYCSPDLPKDEVYEYVKCINPSGWSKTIKANDGNLIFKTSEFDLSLVKPSKEWTWGDVLKQYEGDSWVESTREEYLSQYTVTVNQLRDQLIVETMSNVIDVHNHKTFIEPVHSVNLQLRTKNKSIKF